MNRLREGPGKGPCYAFGSIDLALVIQSFQAQLNLLVGMICVSKSAPVSLTRKYLSHTIPVTVNLILGGR